MKNYLATAAIFGSAVLPMAAAAYEASEYRCDHFEVILMSMERAGGVHVANVMQNGEEMEVYMTEKGRYFIFDWNEEEICSSPAPKSLINKIKR